MEVIRKSPYPPFSLKGSRFWIQSLSRVWLFATPCTTTSQASLSITNSQSPPKPMSIESVMPSNHLILCRPLLLLPSIFPSITVFSNESAVCIRWPKYCSVSFNISLSNEHPGLISFRLDWLDLPAVQRYANQEIPDVAAGFRKGRGARDQIATFSELKRKLGNSKKNIYLCFIDCATAFHFVNHNKLWKTIKERGIPDHLTCLLRNLYAGQEATVRTLYGTTDWFKIEKGGRQGCLLPPCLFNL